MDFNYDEIAQRREEMNDLVSAELEKQIEENSARMQTELPDNLANANVWLESTDFATRRSFDYSPRSEKVKRLEAKLAPSDAIPEQADPLQAPAGELTKHQKNAIKQEKVAMLHEYEMKAKRIARLRSEKGAGGITKSAYKEEKALLEEKLLAIDKSEYAAMKDLKSGDSRGKLLIKVAAQQDRVNAHASFARLLPADSKVRLAAMLKKEESELKRGALNRELTLYKLKKEGKTKEYDREVATDRRHSAMRLMRTCFGDADESLSYEDASYNIPKTRKRITNEGRMFFGGTKPMYIFRQRDDFGNVEKEYLYKEAVTCVGFKKPDRAFATEAASKIQRLVCGDKHYVHAFVAKNKKGEAIGTFQEKLVKAEGGMDIFEWQSEPKTCLTQKVSTEILREHVLDWLLCNYDTKGENFINTKDGLTSIDKEASFTYLRKSEARHMSMTYAPHGNDTIYNVMFKRFVEGAGQSVMEELDLDSIDQYITKIENRSTDEYISVFKEMLDARYGPAETDGAINKKRAVAERLIRERKDNIREEYRTFFGKMLAQKRENIEKKMRDGNAAANAELQAFDEKYGRHLDLTDAAAPKYRFGSEI